MKTFCGYIVTTTGELYSLKTGERKYTWHNQGRSAPYERVQLCIGGKKKNFYVHRIVASVYCQSFSPSLEVNHKDGNTLNNSADNLECLSHSDNIRHSHQIEGRKVYKRIKGTKAIVKEGMVREYITA